MGGRGGDDPGEISVASRLYLGEIAPNAPILSACRSERRSAREMRSDTSSSGRAACATLQPRSSTSFKPTPTAPETSRRAGSDSSSTPLLPLPPLAPPLLLWLRCDLSRRSSVRLPTPSKPTMPTRMISTDLSADSAVDWRSRRAQASTFSIARNPSSAPASPPASASLGAPSGTAGSCVLSTSSVLLSDSVGTRSHLVSARMGSLEHSSSAWRTARRVSA